MTTTIFFACKKDNNNKTQVSDNTPADVVMEYSLEISDDMVASLNMTVDYYDTDGSIKTEPMTAKNWSKTIKAKLPATHGMRLKAMMKDNANIDSAANFNISYSYSFISSVVTSDGTKTEKGFVDSNSNKLPIKGAKVTEWISKKADGIVSRIYSFDEKGDYTNGSWE